MKCHGEQFQCRGVNALCQRKLAFPGHDIMDRILTGDVPESLALERSEKDFPLDWTSPALTLCPESSLPLVTGEIAVRENWQISPR